MSEVQVQLRVVNHTTRPADAWWHTILDTDFLPDVGDEIQLWGREDGPVAAVTRRWWRTDGIPVVQLVQLIVDSQRDNSPSVDERGRLSWVPWHSDKGDPAALLRSAGWAVLQG